MFKTAHAQWLSIVVLIASIGVAGIYTKESVAAPKTACECWYAGYEDGSEYPWGQRVEASDYKRCVSAGKVQTYERGFKSKMEKKQRQCPVSMD